MADLDDFFSKRDKKKKTGVKGKTFEHEDVAKILEAKAKERKNKETHKSTYQAPPSDTPEVPLSEYKATEGDDEWKEVVEEKPDYTGLKIQELILEDSEDEVKEGEAGDDAADKEGPWHKARAARQAKPVVVEKPPEPIPVVPAPEEAPAPEAEKNTSEPDQEGQSVFAEGEEGTEKSENEPTTEEPKPDQPEKQAYIPPSVRKAMAEAAALEAQRPKGPGPAAAATPAAEVTPRAPSGAGGGAYVPPSRRAGATPSGSGMGTRPRRTAAAPNINDEAYFPSLGDALSGKAGQRS